MNRLGRSSSPYLRQHALNPVDWFEWGPEAFEEARARDRPILLSVGYSACHWCHVMARESFESPAIAALMNASFVNVKVDREERPDVDALYMEAVQRMTGRGGWPMTVFLTPEGEPFHGGTYFPPVPRHGMMAFPQLLDAVAAAWRERRRDVTRQARALAQALQTADQAGPASRQPGADLVAAAETRVVAAYDRLHGGFGGAPKFPSHGVLEFLLGRYVRAGRPETAAAITGTLDAMAAGGVYDQLGGGFHRYAVDASWTVPHFEKMLYDNAQLVRHYALAWSIWRVPRYRVVAEETADYLLREMRHQDGAFYAAQDADSSGGEGAAYTWTVAQVRAALSTELADAALPWYGVTETGDVAGASVLTARCDADALASRLGLTAQGLEGRLQRVREGLLQERRRRPPPATDTKVLLEWNALAVDALARAGMLFGRLDYLDAARTAALFLLDQVRDDAGAARSWHDGRVGAPAFLEDLAALGDALLTLYEATYDPMWVARARELAAEILEAFLDPGRGFFRNGPRHDPLVARQKDLTDTPAPSGNAMAARLLVRLAGLTGEDELVDHALGALRVGGGLMERAPAATGALLAVLDDLTSGARQVAIVGSDAADLLAVVRGTFLPGTVVAWAADGDAGTGVVRLLAGRRPAGGRPAAYVCQGTVCGAPVTEPKALASALGCRLEQPAATGPTAGVKPAAR